MDHFLLHLRTQGGIKPPPKPPRSAQESQRQDHGSGRSSRYTGRINSRRPPSPPPEKLEHTQAQYVSSLSLPSAPPLSGGSATASTALSPRQPPMDSQVTWGVAASSLWPPALPGNRHRSLSSRSRPLPSLRTKAVPHS